MTVAALELQHYPGMTERALHDIATTAIQRWSLNAVRIVHRTGPLAAAEQIVFVGVASTHRAAAFQGCEYIMDRLKTEAPFWKKIHATDGSAHWANARDSDAVAARRWLSDQPAPRRRLHAQAQASPGGQTAELSGPEFIRYSRQLMLEKFGEAGQEALKASTVLIAGLGGLGAPAALYLAAAGVGHLILADCDIVELSNLQRQIIYTTDDLGEPKVLRSQQQLTRLNSHVRLTTLARSIDDDALAAVLHDCNLVLDCTDNLPTRQTINRACVTYRIPLISAAALRWDGSLSLFDARRDDSSCYACLVHPDSALPAMTCSNSGVAGPVLGTLGSLQALAALQTLSGEAVPDYGTVRHFDGKRLQWRTSRIPRKTGCPVCGPRNTS